MTIQVLDSEHVQSKTRVVNWVFPAGTGLQEGPGTNLRGWEIVSVERYTTNNHLQKSHIQISNGSAYIAQHTVPGLSIETSGTAVSPVIAKPSSDALLTGVTLRAIVDGDLTPGGETITVFLKSAV